MTPDASRSPGRKGPLVPLVSRPTGVTGRPLGGAKVNGACATFGVADAAGTDPESEPGRAILKPIVRPPTTASRSQQMVRKGTL